MGWKMRLENKVGIVTGGAGGIGSASARKLLQEGALVVLADVESKAAEAVRQQLAEEFGADRVVVEIVDVSNFHEVCRLVEKTVERFGKLDIMFNNAGIGKGVPLLDQDPERDYVPLTKVNQDGVYHGILASAKQFVRQASNGVIINTSSIYGSSAADMAFTYSANKAAILSFTRSAAFELAEHGIRVVAISPGRVRTPILDQFSAEQNQVFASEQLRAKLTEAEEIANVVAFLAGPESNAINGTEVMVDDGYSVFKNRFEPLAVRN